MLGARFLTVGGRIYRKAREKCENEPYGTALESETLG